MYDATESQKSAEKFSHLSDDERAQLAKESKLKNLGFSLVAPIGAKVDHGVNIGADAVSGRNYAQEIIDGIKTIETRTTKGAIPKSMFH